MAYTLTVDGDSYTLEVTDHDHTGAYLPLTGGTITGDVVVSSQLAVGSGASIQTDRLADFNETRTDVTGNIYDHHITTVVSPSGGLTGTLVVRPLRTYMQYASAVDGTGANKAYLRGLSTRVETATTATGVPYELTGLYTDAVHQGTGNIVVLYGVYLGIQSRDTGGEAGDVASMYGAAVKPWLTKNTGIVTNLYGISIDNPGGGGLLTNLYGVYLEDLSAGSTLNYAIYLAGTSGLARQGIWWNGDTNLYRGAANQLKSDDALALALGAGFFGVTPPPSRQTYAVTNAVADRAFDANATTLEELADVLGTLIADVKLWGILA